MVATSPGRYSYEDLARAFGTLEVLEEKGNPFEVQEGEERRPLTAEEVGDLFGIGKQRALIIEATTIKKIQRLIAGRDGLPKSLRAVATWIDERMPEDLEDQVAQR